MFNKQLGFKNESEENFAGTHKFDEMIKKLRDENYENNTKTPLPDAVGNFLT